MPWVMGTRARNIQVQQTDLTPIRPLILNLHPHLTCFILDRNPQLFASPTTHCSRLTATDLSTDDAS